MRMEGRSLLELQLDLFNRPDASIVNVNIDEYRVSTNPRLAMYPCRENDLLNPLSLRDVHLIGDGEGTCQVDQGFLSYK